MNWFTKNWAAVGLFTGILIVIILILSSDYLSYNEVLLRLQVSFLMFHQFEEYILPGGFKKFFNEELFPKRKNFGFNLSDPGILIINVIFGWTVYVFAAYSENIFPWFAAGIIVLTVINGLLHTAAALIKKKYNPGLITGLFLFIPIGTDYFLSNADDMSTGFIFKAALTALAGCIIIPVTILMTGKRENEIDKKENKTEM
ncbi:MAG: HXXEE domain-containing protein [Bacteroidetes bacterium]|nr:HXXEE domain-containing protein [Bacteroidota bacterium]